MIMIVIILIIIVIIMMTESLTCDQFLSSSSAPDKLGDHHDRHNPHHHPHYDHYHHHRHYQLPWLSMIGCFIEAWPQTLSKELWTKNIKSNIILSIIPSSIIISFSINIRISIGGILSKNKPNTC